MLRHSPGYARPDMASLIAQLATLKDRRTIRVAYEMGKLVASRVYGADPNSYRASGQQHPLYRELINHPRLGVSPVTIWRSLGVYELCCRLPHVLHSDSLRLGHVYAVLGLPGAVQEQLLRHASESGLSVNELVRRTNCAPRRSSAGRPRRTALDRAVTSLRAFVELAREISVEPDVRGAQRARALALLRETRVLCDQLTSALDGGPPRPRGEGDAFSEGARYPSGSRDRSTAPAALHRLGAPDQCAPG